MWSDGGAAQALDVATPREGVVGFSGFMAPPYSSVQPIWIATAVAVAHPLLPGEVADFPGDTTVPLFSCNFTREVRHGRIS